jgi:hypothetical protein
MVATTGEATRDLRVEVRRSEAGATKKFMVSMAALPRAPAESDADVEVVLEGDRCPPA